jgi:S1-C subfamily serine protease
VRTLIAILTGFAVFGSSVALAQTAPSKSSTTMKGHGDPLMGQSSNAVRNLSFGDAEEWIKGIPTERLSKLAQRAISESPAKTRSAKDAQIYRMISPAVVLIATKEGLGSGSLIDAAGDIITNWHVVNGFEYVAVVFKPSVEGAKPTRDDMKLGHVVKFDQIADLALVKAAEVPVGRVPVRLGDSSEIGVGVDVHAIGHPTGEAWSYTTGIISQYRQGYVWQAQGDPIEHRANVIQTQTPINPGNSGGPLISDGDNLVGVNSFKAGGEGLNFAVSVDDVKRFLAQPGNMVARQQKALGANDECKPKELSRFRDNENKSDIISYDMLCTGKDTAELVFPDDQSKAVFLRIDRNGDGQADVMIFDLRRQGRWDISLWDNNFEGHWTLVGYHDDGSLKPTRFESFAEFQRRTANR